MIPSTPTTEGVAASILAQIEAAIGQTTPLLEKAFSRVLSKALGGMQVILYKYAGFMFLQMFVEYATAEETVVNGKVIRPLVEIGKQLGVGEPLAATRAEVMVEVTVKLQSGVLGAGSQLLHPASGVLYLTVAAVPLNAATVAVTARASSDQHGGAGEGAVGNREPGEILSFANPLPNIARDAVVQSQSVTGSDAEDVEVYRARIMRRIQRRPQGGAPADYQEWGESVAGILNVYPYGGAPGEEDVYVEATEDSSGSEDGIPTSAQLAQVLAAIEFDDAGLASRRPAGAAVNVLPITRRPFDIIVTGLGGQAVAELEDAIAEAADEYLRSREPFIVGLSTLPRTDRITQAAVAGVIDEVVSAAGGAVGLVTLVDGGPIHAHTLANGEKAKLGNLTFN
jgi:uncharacterized phage protein gp47/JayE